MTEHERVARAVYRHEWRALDEWVASLDELADMTDEEIDRMVADCAKSGKLGGGE